MSGGYDTVKFHFNLEDKPLLVRYLSAQIWTTIVGSLCYPIDTIKRRLMIQDGRECLVNISKVIDSSRSSSSNSGHRKPKMKYMTAREICVQLYRDEGIRGFYSGLSVNVVRGISGAILLVGYDEAKKLLL